MHPHQGGTVHHEPEDVVHRLVAERFASTADDDHVGFFSRINHVDILEVLPGIAVRKDEHARARMLRSQVQRGGDDGRDDHVRLDIEPSLTQRRSQRTSSVRRRVGDQAEREAAIPKQVQRFDRPRDRVPRHGEHAVDVEQHAVDVHLEESATPQG